MRTTSKQQARLDTVTSELDEVNSELARLEKRKTALRAGFFDLANDVLIKNGLADDETAASTMKFAWTNEGLGKVFTRLIATVGTRFDIKRFCEEQSLLAKHCTKTITLLDEDKAEALTAADPDMVSVFQSYTIPGKPQVKLGSPRAVTEADLA